MAPDLARLPIRIARPSRDLAAAERFWADGLGLDVLLRRDADAEGGRALLMLGATDAPWHLELVADADAHAAARPGPEDLLVIYVGKDVEPELVSRLTESGGTPVASANPYWDHGGVTVQDPDGYRLVLTSRTWP